MIINNDDNDSNNTYVFQIFPFANHFRVDKFLSIKIADFGLTKDVYSTEYYRVDKHTTLPVKWMSLESLLDGYFDEKTDVVCNVCVTTFIVCGSSTSMLIPERSRLSVVLY